MRYEIQVHFENQGQLQWHEDIEDVDEWMANSSEQIMKFAHDPDTGRHFMFRMSKIVAIILVNRTAEPEQETDLFRRAYAPQKE